MMVHEHWIQAQEISRFLVQQVSNGLNFSEFQKARCRERAYFECDYQFPNEQSFIRLLIFKRKSTYCQGCCDGCRAISNIFTWFTPQDVRDKDEFFVELKETLVHEVTHALQKHNEVFQTVSADEMMTVGLTEDSREAEKFLYLTNFIEIDAMLSEFYYYNDRVPESYEEVREFWGEKVGFSKRVLDKSCKFIWNALNGFYDTELRFKVYGDLPKKF